MSRIPLATTLRTRTGAPSTKDARQVNSYVEIKGDQSAVRKRPAAQGGISVGTGTAQGGIGLTIGGVPTFIGFWGDTIHTYTGSGTSWSSGASYLTGDHVAVDFVDYWAINNNTNSQPPSGNWSRTYVPAVPAVLGWQWVSTTMNINTNYDPCSLIYAASKYILLVRSISTQLSYYMTSADGITWSALSATGANIFDANGSSGSSWTNIDADTASNGTKIVKISMYSTAGSTGYITSTDGTTWAYSASPTKVDLTTNRFQSIAYGVGVFVWTYTNATTGLDEIYSSPDAITWTKRGALNGMVSFANGKFFLGLLGAINTTYYSTDGITWNTITMPTTKTWSAVQYIGGLYVWFTVVDGGGSSGYATSTDGITWSARTDLAGEFFNLTCSANDGTRVVGTTQYSLNNTKVTSQTTDGLTATLNNDNTVLGTTIAHFADYGTSIISVATITATGDVIIGKLT